jgi:hypothetical protein
LKQHHRSRSLRRAQQPSTPRLAAPVFFLNWRSSPFHKTAIRAGVLSISNANRFFLLIFSSFSTQSVLKTQTHASSRANLFFHHGTSPARLQGSRIAIAQLIRECPSAFVEGSRPALPPPEMSPAVFS